VPIDDNNEPPPEYRSDHPRFPHYLVSTSLSSLTPRPGKKNRLRDQLHMDAEAMPGAVAFANAALIPGTFKYKKGQVTAEYDNERINAAFVSLDVRLTDRAGNPAWTVINVLVGLDNLVISAANPHGQVYLDYGDGYDWSHVHVKTEPDDDAPRQDG
jgi:hypothetical protein